MARVSKDKCIEEVKELKRKGELNPVIVDRKNKGPLDTFFNSKKTKQSFVKRDSHIKVKIGILKKRKIRKIISDEDMDEENLKEIVHS